MQKQILKNSATIISLLGVSHVFAAQNERPNFVVIMCDDVSSDMFGCYANKNVTTPNIDRLAADGVAFSSAWNSALSGPARAQVMTGKYATQTGAWYNAFFIPQEDGSMDLFKYNPTFSKILQDAGYATATAGKWHVGGAEHQNKPIVGFDEYCMWEGLRELEHELGIKEWKGGVEDKGGTARYWNPCIIQNGKLVETTPADFGPTIFTNFICDFIARKSKEDAPFLAYYPMVLPHGPNVRTPLSTKAGSNSTEGISRQENDERWVEMVNYADVLIGEIIETLKKSGTFDNTIIIFTADNGTAITAKSRGVERGCLVPFVISGKGVEKRGMVHEICDSSDILPTLLDFAGAEYPLAQSSAPDGVSMRPFVTGEAKTHKEYIHSCIGTTQLLRTREHMLEVYNPILGVPEGRFYYCGKNNMGTGYERAEGVEPHEKVRREMLEILRTKYVGLSPNHPGLKSKSGERFMKSYSNSKTVEKHIYDHSDYQRYDQELK